MIATQFQPGEPCESRFHKAHSAVPFTNTSLIKRVNEGLPERIWKALGGWPAADPGEWFPACGLRGR